MKTIAATIPSLESASAFTPDQAEVYEAQEKQLEESIGGAAAKNVLAAPFKRPEATLWPALPEGSPEGAPTPSRLRIDVGWHLWQQDGEGTDLQYQVRQGLRPVELSLAGAGGLTGHHRIISMNLSRYKRIGADEKRKELTLHDDPKGYELKRLQAGIQQLDLCS